MRTRHLLLQGLLYALAAAPARLNAQATGTPPTTSYSYATNGVIDDVRATSGASWKLVVDKSNLGGTELEVAEVTLTAGTNTRSHGHGSVEVIYVLSGTYDHEVNGKTYRLTEGMVGIVRPGDEVRHLVPSDADAKLLILWAPAGEAARVFTNATGTTPEPVPELQR